MNQAEKDLRVQLAACYRIFDYMGWSELIYNHITVKVPGDEGHFLICLLYTSPSPRDGATSRMPSSA